MHEGLRRRRKQCQGRGMCARERVHVRACAHTCKWTCVCTCASVRTRVYTRVSVRSGRPMGRTSDDSGHLL